MVLWETHLFGFWASWRNEVVIVLLMNLIDKVLRSCCFRTKGHVDIVEPVHIIFCEQFYGRAW